MAELPGDRSPTHSAQRSRALLIEALRGGDEESRLRAARALRRRSSPEAVEALLAVLDDENAGVRWLAGEALVHIGAPSVVPLLHRLVQSTGNAWLYEEAEHVLRRLQLPQFGGAVTPVVEALEHSTTRDVEVPVKAELALQQIMRTRDTGQAGQ
jgi:HEAT repeat protein